VPSRRFWSSPRKEKPKNRPAKIPPCMRAACHSPLSVLEFDYLANFYPRGLLLNFFGLETQPQGNPFRRSYHTNSILSPPFLKRKVCGAVRHIILLLLSRMTYDKFRPSLRLKFRPWDYHLHY
jgi:hypothetical protein